MSQLALSAYFEYLCYRSTVNRNILFFQCEDRLYTSESDVYRRQILTYKDGSALKGLNNYLCQIFLTVLHL